MALITFVINKSIIVVVFVFQSTSTLCIHKASGDKGIRTLDPLRARQVLSQLSYTPINLATTYSPSPSPDKYHRPLKS